MQIHISTHILTLEVAILREDDNPVEILNIGGGDFIAANFTITPQRRQKFDFSTAYDIVSQVIALGTDGNYEVPVNLDSLHGMRVS